MRDEVVITEHELPQEVIAAIQGGRRIEAIKLLREAKGLGLANAQVLVDRAWRTYGPTKPILNFADQPRGPTLFAKSLGMVMVLLVTTAFYFYSDS